MKSWFVRSATVVLLGVVLISGCSKTPTGPTPEPPPPPPPPVANPPSLTCGDGLSRATTSATGLELHFNAPPPTDGQGSVNVTCSPNSGFTFPIGTTPVTCTATDSLNRTATCTFNVTISRIPQISHTKFLAFGDSITAGEVTVPLGAFFNGDGRIHKQVLVPAAAYPSVLLRTLQGRYSSQAGAFVVANYGVAGEKAINARDRFTAALNAVRPEVVLLIHGHNDIPGGNDGAASGAAREMEIMVQEARLRGMRVYLSTIAPPRSTGNRPIEQRWVDDFNGRIRVIAARQGVRLVDVYAALITDVPRYIGVDGLHPTEAGYAKIADTFFQVIQSELEVR
ncbi:MAG TPA: GDSL-type esterase/lipase family protein [Vicinamibacterales bacterium]|nr:GDSL-type esterase/lipase family protein [Vicinamibacterales bacterium]